MAITVEAFTGSAVSVSTSEISLINGTTTIATNATAGIYQAFVDLNALIAGDAFDFKVYEKVLTGGVQRVVYVANFAQVQTSPIWVSPTLVLGIGWDMTLKNILGAARAITWRISKVA